MAGPFDKINQALGKLGGGVGGFIADPSLPSLGGGTSWADVQAAAQAAGSAGNTEYIGDPTIVFGGGSPVGASSAEAGLSDQDIFNGLIALGWTPEDALTIMAQDAQDGTGNAVLLVNGGIGPTGGGSGGSGGGGGGGADNTVGLAQVNLGYAQLGESQRQFDTTYAEGVRQFDATFNRNNFESDREYELAKEQFAMSYAENKRQFDLEYGLSSELGRGNLALGQDRLALDRELGTGELQLGRDRLGLDTELGRGRLALDTELGRGELALGRDRLSLDDRLGTGRLNLDTELGRGQLGINQQAEGRLQRAQVAAERLANRDQELQRTQFVTDVLRKPSDFLARAFMQRGGTAPTGMVTQADIINNLKNGINQFAQGGTTNDPIFTTGEQGGTLSTEMIYNPTGAPLQIFNPMQTQQMMGRLPNINNGMQPQSLNYLAEPMYGGRPEQRPGGQPVQGRIQQQPQQPNYMPQQPQGGASIQPVGGTGYNPNYMQPGSQPDWNAAYNSTLDTINGMSLPDVTQQQLIQIGLDNLPPAVKAALFGGAGDMPAARPVAGLTLGRLARLTPGELEALNTQLGVQFNTDLQTEMALLQERFGPVVNRARGRLVLQ